MLKGCFTALITPFDNYGDVDFVALKKLVDFQIKNNVTGILATGTTGESPTLSWDEHNKVIEKMGQAINNKCYFIAGTGSNSTKEAICAADHAVSSGANALLLVDPYYNGPSSLEIRREYLEPIAKRFPDTQIIPYVIPGRTGTQLFPEDLAIAHNTFSNINTVKEATGDMDNIKKTRKYCGKDFSILSGDDPITFNLMTDEDIKAAGVISVASNIFPNAVTKMVNAINDKDFEKAQKINNELMPLFKIVSFSTAESTKYGNVKVKARNPLPYKMLMHILGMPSGLCRPPIGKLTKNALDVILKAVNDVYSNSSDLFNPIAEFFNIDIAKRLKDSELLDELCYSSYS